MNEDESLESFTKLSGEMKANLAILIEKGVCKVNASASIVTMPTVPDYTLKSKQNLDTLPQSAKDIYFKQHKKGISQQDSDFFDDNWYFIELHQSILQESTQNK